MNTANIAIYLVLFLSKLLIEAPPKLLVEIHTTFYHFCSFMSIPKQKQIPHQGNDAVLKLIFFNVDPFGNFFCKEMTVKVIDFVAERTSG